MDLLKDDEVTILNGIKKHGLAIEFASERLKDKKEVVMAAVKNHGLAVKFASERLKEQNGHFENKPIAVLENELDRSGKKRSRSPSRDEDFSAQSPSKKPKEEKRWDDKIFEVADDATNGIDMLDKIHSEENMSKPNTTNLKQSASV